MNEKWNTWDCFKNKRIETPNDMKKFIEEIEVLCKKYNFSISHEDCHGAFEIERYDEGLMEWFKHAHKSYKN